MTTDRRDRVLRLYHSVLVRDSAGRHAFLAEACAADDELRRDVEALLAKDPPSGFLGEQMSPVGSASFPLDNPLLGQRVGVYRVDAKLGSGGMGEVFRARDTKLGRDVALKMLPPLVGRDPERLARFEREARILATLNHRHIASIYGLEDAHGSPALVLELVEGETLAERLARTKATAHAGLPIAEAVAVARQIAEALDAAHDKGVVHRDLKPANIKFAADGSVKVLDFGLAKAMAVGDESAPLSCNETGTGVAIGTVPYMSPEQARGERVDKRTDIWAFGCVLCEMLTGHSPFGRATAAETVAAILHQEPDWTALPVETPLPVWRVLERCLQKDARTRLRDISGAQLALTDALDAHGLPHVMPPAAPAATAARSMWRRASPVLASLLVGGLVAGLALRRGQPEARPGVTRLSISGSGNANLQFEGNQAITPDGSRVVYVGGDGRIFVRALNELEPKAIAAGTRPFVSPDGQWVGFEQGSSLKKVPIAGGLPIVIVRIDGLLRGAVWLADNTIVFSTQRRATGLQRVSAGGGEPEALTAPDAARNEYDHYWPDVLPDGRGVLYTRLSRTGGLGEARIAVHDLQTHTSKDLLTGGSNARYLRSGHLLYVAGETLWAVPFDADRRGVIGVAVPVLNQVHTTGNGWGSFAVSPTGTLVYAPASGYDPFARTLSWIDRSGRLEPLKAPQHWYSQPRFSHDGKRVVYSSGVPPENNPWVLDVSRGTVTRLRREAAREQQPSWSPDDRWILFASDRDGTHLKIWRQAADGTGEPELLVDRGVLPIVTPDGTHLIYVDEPTPGNHDVMQMALDGSRRVSPLVKTRFNEQGADISPDGGWLAYVSDMSGRTEVYVSPYPNTATGRWQVSAGGVGALRWARDGRELFFMAPDGALMGVQVKATGQTWAATAPVKVLDPGRLRAALIGPAYDVSPDGKRFLVVTPPKEVADPPDLVVVQHWDQELKARVAGK
jgi:eukaryotic-like serine/threonine-protein kinase